MKTGNNVSNSGEKSTKDPVNYNLPRDYIFVDQPWGKLFYKVHGERNYLDAKAQCESDGAHLATPKSESENDFLADLVANLNPRPFWIGVNDIDQEGEFISIDGDAVSFTKWHNGEPNNSDNEDGIVMNWHNWLPDKKGFWNDYAITNRVQFVCFYRINGKRT